MHRVSPLITGAGRDSCCTASAFETSWTKDLLIAGAVGEGLSVEGTKQGQGQITPMSPKLVIDGINVGSRSIESQSYLRLIFSIEHKEQGFLHGKDHKAKKQEKDVKLVHVLYKTKFSIGKRELLTLIPAPPTNQP